jgi:hypothetical protein
MEYLSQSDFPLKVFSFGWWSSCAGDDASLSQVLLFFDILKLDAAQYLAAIAEFSVRRSNLHGFISFNCLRFFYACINSGRPCFVTKEDDVGPEARARPWDDRLH